jgi:hypothetical protein
VDESLAEPRRDSRSFSLSARTSSFRDAHLALAVSSVHATAIRAALAVERRAVRLELRGGGYAIQNAAKLRPQANADDSEVTASFSPQWLAAASAMATLRWKSVHIRYSM